MMWEKNFKSFNTVMKTMQTHYLTIATYFDSRRSNSSAESFMAKIKTFRGQFTGVINRFHFVEIAQCLMHKSFNQPDSQIDAGKIN